MNNVKFVLVELHKKHFKSVVEYFYSKTRDFALSEDLAQETFLKLCKVQDTNKLNVKYLFGIAPNVLRDHWKSSQRVPIEYVADSEKVMRGLSQDYSEEKQEKQERVAFEQQLATIFSHPTAYLTEK